MDKITPRRFALMSTFVRIASTGSFSRAARQLCSSQPTVSRQLRQLEAHLGVHLVNRTTHGLSLTEAGRHYYEYTHTMLEGLDRFENELRGDNRSPCGLLRVVVPSGFGQGKLIEIAAQYLMSYPSAHLEWRLSESPIHFMDDAVDCAIQVGTIRNELLVARKLGEVNKIITVSPSVLSSHGSICKPEDLSTLPWVSFSNQQDRSIHLQDRQGNLRKLNVSPSFTTDSVQAARQAALLGVGVTLISRCAIASDIESGNLVHVLPTWSGTSVPIYLTYPRSRHYPSKLRKFIDLISSMSPQLFPSQHQPPSVENKDPCNQTYPSTKTNLLVDAPRERVEQT